MYRSKSFTSLFSMSQFNFANSPYEIYDPSSPFDDPNYGAQPFNDNFHEPAQESSDNSDDCSSEESAPKVQADPNVLDITFTETSELRSVLATLSNYTSGQLGTHLRDYRGVIILPIEAVTAIRTPQGNHSLNYQCIVFYPHQSLEHYVDTLPNLVESINVLYNNK